MAGDPNGRMGESAGEHLAADMLKAIVRLNENIEKSHAMYQALAEGVADLVDYHETYMRASEILIEQAEEGKMKFSLGDLVKALAEAAEEVMPDEEDEPGPEDPRVEVER